MRVQVCSDRIVMASLLLAVSLVLNAMIGCGDSTLPPEDVAIPVDEEPIETSSNGQVDGNDEQSIPEPTPAVEENAEYGETSDPQI